MRQWTFTLKQTERGWDVGQHDEDGCSFPITSYPNAYKAAARLLQLMEISTPVEPQSYPESIGISLGDG